MKKKYLIKYSFEFVVIVIGISVSFWLNELSIDNQNELERIKVLNSLKMEINEIRDYTFEREKTWVTDLRLLNELLFPRNGVIDTDSILKITTAKSRIETHWNNHIQLKPYLIDVLRNRDVSNQIADYFNVRHESPQALVIISMKCKGSFSHNSIEMQKIEAIVGS